jgi:hypothetical protein
MVERVLGLPCWFVPVRDSGARAASWQNLLGLLCKWEHHCHVLQVFVSLALMSIVCVPQVNYFPSRYDPVRHAEKVPYNNTYISGQREKRIIEKENNFKCVLRSLPSQQCHPGLQSECVSN